MFKDFFNQEKLLIGVSGFITAIAGLFLNVVLPADVNMVTKTALQNIQAFWLLLLAALLTVLFVKFVGWVFKIERKSSKKYDVLTFAPISLSVGLLLLWVILNFFQFIINLYPQITAQYLGMSVLLFLIPLLVFLDKVSEKFSLFSQLLIISFVLSSSVSFIGLFIQGLILGYIYFYWGIFVLPSLFVIILLILTGIVKFQGKKLSSYN